MGREEGRFALLPGVPWKILVEALLFKLPIADGMYIFKFAQIQSEFKAWIPVSIFIQVGVGGGVISHSGDRSSSPVPRTDDFLSEILATKTLTD